MNLRTREEAIALLKAERSKYVRDWQKRNPDKVKAYNERSKENKIQKYMNGGC